MHYHLEVIIPPTDDVEGALQDLLKEYNECHKDEDGNRSPYAFYDWYKIGGRWNGYKILCQLDTEQVNKFYNKLKERNVTVSNIVAGKETLSPADQIPMVDKLWQEMFPDCTIKQCPFFDHYKGTSSDIAQLRDIPKQLTAERVIIAKKHWNEKGKLEVAHMVTREIWNGSNYEQTKWNGKVSTAINQYKKKVKDRGYKDEMERLPKPNWLCVTIDYHS